MFEPKRIPTLPASLRLHALMPHVILMLLLAQFVAAVPSAAEDAGWYEVRPDVVNLRGGPGTYFAVFGQLRRGDLVYVDHSSAGWAAVDINDDGSTDGWIRFDLLAEPGSTASFSDFGFDDSEMVFFWIVGLLLLLLYMLPAVIAACRGHHNAWAIFALNFLLGWTWLGWVIAFVWALTAVDPSKRARPQKWLDQIAE